MHGQITVEPSKKIGIAKGSAKEDQTAEIKSVPSREQVLEAALIEMQAEKQQLRFLLTEAQATIGHLVAEKERLAEEVKELKQKPFKLSKKSETKPVKKQGRPKGGTRTRAETPQPSGLQRIYLSGGTLS